jgi:hypothetical protein
LVALAGFPEVWHPRLSTERAKLVVGNSGRGLVADDLDRRAVVEERGSLSGEQKGADGTPGIFRQ